MLHSSAMSTPSQIRITAAFLALTLIGLGLWAFSQRGESDFLRFRSQSHSTDQGVDVVTSFFGDPDQPKSLRGEFILPIGNLADPHRVRMSVLIEVEDEEDRSNLSKEVPKLRDSFISRIADSNVTQFEGKAGLARSRKLLLEAVHDAAPGLRVRAIYFSEFLVE